MMTSIPKGYRERQAGSNPLRHGGRNNVEFIALISISVLLLAWIWGTVFVDTVRRDERAVAAVRRANANLVTVVAEHTTRTLAALDQIAKLAKARYEELGPKFDADRFVKDVGFDGNLVLGMIIVDEHGIPLATSRAIPAASFADRPYFQRHRSEKLGRSIIGAPIFGRVVPRWVMPMSWRLDKPDGSFGGMLSMGINPYHFTDVYRRIDIGQGSVITLIGSDGIVRVRLSGNETTFGQDITGSPSLAAAQRSGRGSIIHEAAVDGVRRLYSYDSLRDYPLHVMVGSAMDAVLEESRAERREDYLHAGGASAALIAAALLLGFFKARQRRSDRALELAQSQQRAIFDSMADPAWLKDAEGRFVAVNRSFERVFRTTAAEVIGATRPELFGSTGTAGQEASSPSLGAPYEEQRSETRLQSADGEVWLETATTPIVASGGITGTAGTARDITARKRLERELKESHGRLNLALTHADMAVWEWDIASDGVIHTAGLPRLLGCSDGCCIETHAQWLQHIHAEDRARVEAAVHECLNGSREYNDEYRVYGCDGVIRWVQDRGAVTAVSAAGAVTVVSGIVQDVSVRKAAELALRESEQRFRLLVENMDDVFWIGSPSQGVIHYLSSGFRRTLGIEPNIVYQEPHRWREFVHPDDVHLALEFIAQQLCAEPATCEARLRQASGSYRWMHMRSVPWRDTRGTLLVAGMAEDVTERKQANEQRLREAERQRDALVMEVHHRIKNNLQGVLGLLEEHRHADAATRSLLRTLATRIQSVATVHGLQGRRAGSVILLVELVTAIADNARGLGEASIDLAMPPGQEDFQIKERESVPVALILNELIWNAIKHSSEAPRRVRVAVQGASGGSVVVEIRNRGDLAGDASDRQRLSGGIGLGLIRALMPPQGAKLSLEAADGEVVATLVLFAPVLDCQCRDAAA